METPHLCYENSSSIHEGDVSKNFAVAQSNLGTIPGKMTIAEQEKYNKAQQDKREKEDSRLYRLRQRDEDIEEHFKRTHHNRLTM